VPVPARGRTFRAARRVRLADADPSGRLRLDALARFLQDVGNDDIADAGGDVEEPWVARRSTVVAPVWPRLGEMVTVTTFCGGLGGRWAERRSSLVGEHGARVEVAALWVHLDPVTGRPSKLPAWFLEAYAEAAGGRHVGARTRLGPPPPVTEDRPWPLRATDLDVLGHVNNASTWAPVEDECARRGLVPREAELEFGAALDPGDDVRLRVAPAGDGELRLWLAVGDDVRAAAAVRGAGG
jgi:acyl-ACP thioesterase